MVDNGARTGSSVEPIEREEDIGRYQKAVELSKAITDLDDPSMRRNLANEEKRISGHVHRVKLPENVIMVKDPVQMNTLGNLVEAGDNQSPHLAHDTQANTKPVRMAPQYDTYAMTLLSLRIELRMWLERGARSFAIHISTNGEKLLEFGKQRIRWTCVSFLNWQILAGWRLTCLTALRPPFI